ncbi:urea ABC transporter permease subunit UrtB [Rhodoplanes sp.]|uniref:urea ABC transporter permease subunit UrtB n=1 Tax=Rhodoplanes sp. TaxID=1968906 RepID=UPI002600054B|nr:urea ABC transporter permease subunit UrtB [Rhodoplanes sp.]
MTSPTFADAFDDALANFFTNSYADTEVGVTALAAAGDFRAAPVLKALQDGKLAVDPSSRRVLIEDGVAWRDAASGAAMSPAPADLKRVRLNNRLRRAVDAALGALTLRAPDPARRLEAAQAVFKSRDAGALAAVDAALAQETDARVKAALADARAAILITSAEAPEAARIEAVAVLRERGDQSALALLGSLPPGTPAILQRAADSAASAIRGRLQVWEAVQNAWYGLSLGSVLLLAAIGLAITFGVMGVINMAHGEMVMLGAYTTFVVQEAIRQKAIVLSLPGTDIGVILPLPAALTLDWSLPIAVPLAFVVTGLVGILIERSVIRFLYGRPLETLLATWGISLILQQAVRTGFGPTNKEVSNPSWMSGAFEIGQLAITWNRLWILCFSLATFALLLTMLRWTRLGLEMRAVTQNRSMAAAVGIRTARIDALTFGLGSGIAGIAGVALSQIDNVSPNLGQSYIIDSFMVVVFGGVGNLWGTLVGAFTLGIANKFLEPFAGAVLGKIAILVLIILFIQRRPRGLFALKGRAVEA